MSLQKERKSQRPMTEAEWSFIDKIIGVKFTDEQRCFFENLIMSKCDSAYSRGYQQGWQESFESFENSLSCKYER